MPSALEFSDAKNIEVLFHVLPAAAVETCPATIDMSMWRYNRQGRKANVGAGTTTATEPTREHKQYATQVPTTYLCT